MSNKKSKSSKFEYDVAISYAGEDREIARQIVEALKNRGLSVFYDQFYKSDLWGKSLSKWFKDKFGKSSHFVVVLVSRHYPVKDWTDFEFSAAKAEESKRKTEVILPVRLDNTPMAGLPSDKAYLSFQDDGLDVIADCLVDKVRKATPGKTPRETFDESYQEWKLDGFLPGDAKVRYLLDNINDINLNIETCEFLLRSLTGYHQDLQRKLDVLNKQILFHAAGRMIGKNEAYYTRWRAIRYLVFADAKRSEPYLWDIYVDEENDISLRTEAFGRLWKCDSIRGLDASYAIALNSPQWQLRQAAVKNIGYGDKRNETSVVLSRALKDRRGEVRSQAAYAIVKLNLADLAPDLIAALENERSRKSAHKLLYCLWNFNTHPKVKEFMKKYDLPKWFSSTPDYHAIWTEIMDDIL